MSGIGDEEERKKLVEAFSSVVRPEILEALQSPDFNRVVNSFREAKLNFVILCIDGTVPEEIGRSIGLVADTTRRFGWDVEGMFSNLMVLIDGAPMPTTSERGARTQLVAALRLEQGPKIKMLHGTRNAAWGRYGSETGRSTHGMILPDFIALVAKLSALPNGAVEELAE